MKGTQRLVLFIITLVLPCNASQFMAKWKPTSNNIHKAATPSLNQHREYHVAGPTKHEELQHPYNFDLPVINVMVEAKLPPLKSLQQRVVMVAKRVRDIVCTRKVARLVARRLLLIVINKFTISRII